MISDWLRARPEDAPRIEPFFLGRAEDFPWLSRQIADNALALPDWAERVASVRPGGRHALAAAAIRNPILIERLGAPFAGTGYEFAGLSFEKVLFGNADVHSSRRDAGSTKVPFDAQLWLVLAPARPGSAD